MRRKTALGAALGFAAGALVGIALGVNADNDPDAAAIFGGIGFAALGAPGGALIGAMDRTDVWTQVYPVLLAAVLAQGCVRWEPELVPVAVVLEAEQPRLITVATGDRTTALHDPRIQGDRLIGMTPRGTAAVPLADGSRVWVRRSNPTSTLITIPWLVVVGLGTLTAATWHH